MSLATTPPILPTTLAQDLHRFGSSTDRDEAIEASFRWVDSALGCAAWSVRLSLLDPTGRLRCVSERGAVGDGSRSRSGRRLESLRSRWPSIAEVRRPLGASIATLPLVCRSEALGVLEVVGPAASIRERFAALEVVAAQAATVFRNVGIVEDARRAAEAASEITNLMEELLSAPSRERATGIAARFCWRRLGTPTVGWLLGTGTQPPHLVVTRGVGRETRRALESLGGQPLGVGDLVSRSLEVLGDAVPVITRGEEALLLVRAAPAGVAKLLETVGAGLGLALDRLARTDAIAELVGSIDSGIAWAAHELRAPLLGIEKAVDLVAAADEVPQRERELLARVQAELRRLTGSVDDVLRWSVGAARVRRRPTDLARLVSDVARSFSGDVGDRDLIVSVPERAVISADPLLMRVAIENLVRNSLEHGGDAIGIGVDLTPHDATVTVSDQGSILEAEHGVTIFDPFARGRRMARGGRGLGLLITQRAIQAHGGVLWLEAGADGTKFRMRVPVGAA